MNNTAIIKENNSNNNNNKIQHQYGGISIRTECDCDDDFVDDYSVSRSGGHDIFRGKPDCRPVSGEGPVHARDAVRLQPGAVRQQEPGALVVADRPQGYRMPRGAAEQREPGRVLRRRRRRAVDEQQRAGAQQLPPRRAGRRQRRHLRRRRVGDQHRAK